MSLKRPASGKISASSTTVETKSEANTENVPPLKLRIKEPQNLFTQQLISDISSSVHLNDPLNSISRLSSISTNNLTSDDGEQVANVLKDVLRKAENHDIKGRIILAIRDLMKIPNLSRLVNMDDLVDLAQKEANHHVFKQYLKLFCTVGQLLPAKAEVIQKILKLSYKRLTDSHQDLRCACLNLLSQMCPRDGFRLSGGRYIDFLDLFCEFSADQDPRVRASAIQGLLTLHHRGHSLGLNVYEKASYALNDDYEVVRMAAVKIIWVMSHIYPERLIKSSSSDEKRLVDDAFVKICNMINDGSMIVRAEATGLLGSLHLVSFVYLEQTLDKKLMSHLRKRKSYHEQERERSHGIKDSSSSSGWSTGRKWGDNEHAREKNVAGEEITLMSIGACGAFVRGLEDEFMEVRRAAVDSLCELANQNSSFAAMSCDFLVDMFNDEIESVRLNSINSLIKICEHVDLREEQLDTMFNVLSDSNWEIREGVRELLSHCHLSTRSCLHATILALMQNLKKYPQDRAHIWRCMREIGKRNAVTVSSLVSELLSTHPYFAIPEPNLDDQVYTALAILVFNAAVKCPAVRSLLPEHTKRHYDYLRDSLPELVPELRKDIRCWTNNTANGDKDIESFYRNTLQQARSLGSFDLSAASCVLESCIRDLSHIERVSRRLAPNAHFYSMYIKCINILYRVRAERTWAVPTPITVENSGFFTSAVEELLSLSYRLENTFIGLGSRELASVKLVRVLAHCLQMVLTSRSSSIKSIDRKQHDLDCLQLFFGRIRHFRESVLSADSVRDSGLQAILKCERLLEEGSYSMTRAVCYLQDLLLNCDLRPIDIENPLREMKATIEEPSRFSDSVLRFTSGLTLGIHVDATLVNVTDTSNIFLMVIYPDMKTDLIKPKPGDFRRISDLKHRLVTSIAISHGTWSESSSVQVAVVVKHSTDVDEEKVVAFLQPKKTSDRIIRKSMVNDVTRGLICLCEPGKLTVQPKAYHK